MMSLEIGMIYLFSVLITGLFGSMFIEMIDKKTDKMMKETKLVF